MTPYGGLGMSEIPDAGPTPSEPSHDPFKPPVPPRAASFTTTGDLVPPLRPQTSYSRADSFTYGDMYEGYAGSSRGPTRPGTQFDVADQEPEEMPATSTLLPWLSKGLKTTDAPPVPAFKNDTRWKDEGQMRQPPAAVLAQSPGFGR